jgi:hypothetical protein
MPRKGQLANNDAEEKGRAGFPDVELRKRILESTG